MTLASPPAVGPEFQRALAENARYADQFDRSSLPLPPGRKLAVLACMDARLTVEDVLALRTGDAHIIRNAGGLATDDAIRSLVISQNLLGTEEVIVIEHTGCGMLTFQDEDVRRDLAAKTGQDLDIAFLAFPELESNLREQGCAGSASTPGSRTCRSTARSTTWSAAGSRRWIDAPPEQRSARAVRLARRPAPPSSTLAS